MKKSTIYNSVLLAAIFFMSSCGSGSDKPEAGYKVDHKMLENPETVKEWHKQVVDKLEDHVGKTEQVKFLIDRPSVEGMVKNKDTPDKLVVEVSYLNPENKNQVIVYSFFSEFGWQEPKAANIEVMGTDKEAFKLIDNLYDFSTIKPELISKVVGDALKKYRTDKYKYLYVKSLTISKYGFDLALHGKFASNEQENNEYYRTDLQGRPN